MRVLADTRRIAVEPGTTTALTVEVTNTDDVIDGVSATVLGMAHELVSATPALLPLFPETAGKVTLGLTVPATTAAGRHPLTIQVTSHGAGGPPGHVDIDMDVAAHPGLRLESRPRLIRARRNARCVLELTNTGNVPLEVTLTGRDPDRLVATAFAPEHRRIEPGGVAPVLLSMRGPRMFTGAEIDRTIVVEATARPAVGFVAPPTADPLDATTVLPRIVEPLPAGLLEEPEPEALPEPDLTIVRDRTIQLRQRPFIGRGLLTILILGSIIAIWAAIFLIGLGKVFAGDPMTKQAPASFFASLNNPAGTAGTPNGTGNGAGTGAPGAPGGANGSGTNGSGGSGGAGAAPAGALSKSGQLAPGMGGTITGTVTAVNNQQPVGRILVQAYRKGRSGLVQMSSAATQSDGTYALSNLFPTNYYVRFSSTGFKPVWYPGKPTPAAGQLIPAVAQGTTSGINAAVVGLPAQISGKVDKGDTLTPVVTTVTARQLVGTQTGKAVATAKTTGSGAYTLRNLPAPGSYQLTFETKGYQASTLVESVSGNDRRLEPTVALGAAAGQITGTVRDAGVGLGGVTVTTTVGGRQLTVMTPTTGQVGAYVLGNLPTPATYVVTVSSPGHGTSTRIVDLGAGESKPGFDFTLSNGSGTVSGHVDGPNGKGLGGALVTVGGAVAGATGNLQATTLTDGDPGYFAINGLRAGASYTLTVTLDGYASASVPVTLSGDGSATVPPITLANQLGSIKGRVRDSSGAGFPGATITATNGQSSVVTTSNSTDCGGSASAAADCGNFVLDGLAPGYYSVTATSPGRRQQTALVHVRAGKPKKTVDLTVRT